MFVKDNKEVKSDSSNYIRSFIVIKLQDPDESLKLHTRYRWCKHQRINK